MGKKMPTGRYDRGMIKINAFYHASESIHGVENVKRINVFFLSQNKKNSRSLNEMLEGNLPESSL